MDIDKLKSKYYEMAIRGDFQNETDMIDLDHVWDYIENQLSAFQSELEKYKSSFACSERFRLEDASSHNDEKVQDWEKIKKLSSELEEQKKVTENYKKQWEANSCTVANLADEIEVLKSGTLVQMYMKACDDRDNALSALEQLNVFNDRQELLEFVDKVCQEHNNGGLQ